MEYFRQAAIFLMIAKFFQVFIAKKENQKYIRGFAGILTIGILITPIQRVSFPNLIQNMDKNIEEIQNTNENMAQILLQQYDNQDLEEEDHINQIKHGRKRIDLTGSPIKINMQNIEIPKITVSIGNLNNW